MVRMLRMTLAVALAVLVAVVAAGCIASTPDGSDASASWQTSSSGRPVFYYFGSQG